MKIINTQEELKALIIKNKIVIDDDLTINCDIYLLGINIEARDIKARDIRAWDIKARDIKARDIRAWDIKAGDIRASDIDAWNIRARDIEARDIYASDIEAGDIRARDIYAKDIIYDASAIATKSFVCKSIKGSKSDALHKCQDQEIQFIK